MEMVLKIAGNVGAGPDVGRANGDFRGPSHGSS